MGERTAPVLNIFGPQAGPLDAAARSAIMRTRLERYFELSVFLLLTSGFITIVGTAALDFFSVAFVSLALLVRGWLLLAGSNLSMPQKWDSFFSYGYIAFYAADYFLLGSGFVNSTVHLVLFSMVVKLFSVRRDRDYVYLAVLAFMEVLAASVLTVDTLFLATFLLFALLAVNTFVAFEIRRSWTAASVKASTIDSPRSAAYASRRFARSLSITTFALLVGMAAIGAVMFFVLPRITGGYFSRFMHGSRIESGFSEAVRLGQIGEIEQSNSVAMHVQIFGDSPGSRNLKWRGIALSLFDGRQWFNPLPRNFALPETPGCYNISSDQRNRNVCTPTSDKNVIRYRVLMEPLGTSVFFLAPTGQSLSGRYSGIMADTAGAVYNVDPNTPIGTYEATSDLSVPPPDRLRHARTTYSASDVVKYLQLPTRLDPRVRQLAGQITADAKDPYDKAAAIEHYLQTNFGYTLQLPQTTPADPVVNFLFERKKGHCEYFATAMAIMLRTIGIPSRLVNGFRGGEYNDISGNYIIRARDAHSWVEVYFPGSGWVSFDPTPAGPGADAFTSNRLALYLDAYREFWREWIINYDFGHQRTLGTLGALRVTRTFETMRRWTRQHYFELILRGYSLHQRITRTPQEWTLAGIGSAGLILLLLNINRIRRSILELRISRNPGQAPEAAASLWYRRMTRTVARHGWKKSPTQTPQEFTQTIPDPALRATVALFTDHYERARFADSASDAQKLEGLYEAVRTTAPRPS
jgi:transglutaminase-like putative cysteine protease